jgi:hypothetical protein
MPEYPFIMMVLLKQFFLNQFKIIKYVVEVTQHR